MRFTEKNGIVVISNDVSGIPDYINNLAAIHKDISDKHIIVDLRSLPNIKKMDLKLFLPLSKTHKKQNKSFVFLINEIAPTDIPNAITAAPTLQEAYDIIWFENMEREIDI